MTDDRESTELLLACLRGDGAYVQARLEKGVDLTGVVEAAVRQEVVHRLADGLAPFVDLVPEALTDALAEHGRRTMLHNAGLLAEARRIAAAFAADGCPVLFAKGLFFAALAGDDDRRRLSKDLDIYVGRQDARRAYALLRDLGFDEEHYPLEETLRDSHHHGMYAPASETVVELHWGVAPERESVHLDLGPLIAAPASVEIDGTAFPVPPRIAVPLFIAVELEKDGWRSVKKLLDVARLIEVLPADEAALALERAAIADKTRVLGITLGIVQQLGFARLRAPLADIVAHDAATRRIARFVVDGMHRWGDGKPLGFLVRQELMFAQKHRGPVAQLRYLGTVSLRHALGHWARRRPG